MNTKFSYLTLLRVLIILAALLRIVDCVIDNPLDHIFSDPSRHWHNGERLLKPDLMSASDPILYQIYIFILQKVTGENRFLIGLITGILSAIMPWTYYRAAREMGWSSCQSTLLWAVISWLPSVWMIYNYFMMETLLLPIMGLALWMSARFLRKKSFRSFAQMTFVWILAVLTKSTMVPLGVTVMAFCWWKTFHSWRWMIFAVILALLLMTPATIRNFRIVGFIAPFGQQWIPLIMHRTPDKGVKVIWNKDYFYTMATPSAYTMPFDPLNNWMIHRAYNDDVYTFSVDSSHGDQDWKQAYNSLPFTFTDWLQRQMDNVAIFLFAASWPDATTSSIKGLINYWHKWIWAPIILFVLIGNIRVCGFHRWDFIPIATTVLLIFLMFQPFVTVEGRYRKPIEPLLIMNVMWLFVNLRKREGMEVLLQPPKQG